MGRRKRKKQEFEVVPVEPAPSSHPQLDEEEDDDDDQTMHTSEFVNDAEESDSGEDTDELISFARKSGAMRASKKRKGRGGSGAASSSSSAAPDVTEATFTFFDPRPHDYWSIKRLLANYVLPTRKGEQFNATELADIICAQAAVGTMVKSETIEEQPLGFITAISVQQHAQRESVRQVLSFVRSKCPPEHKARLEQFLDNDQQPLGLLIHERLVNLPSELVPDMQLALKQDLEWAQENEATPELRKSFKFSNVMLISREFFDADTNPSSGLSDDDDSDDEGSSSAAAAAAAARASRSLEDPTSFFKFEDELFLERASLRFRVPFAIPHPTTAMERLQMVCNIAIVPASAQAEIALQLQQMALEEQKQKASQQ